MLYANLIILGANSPGLWQSQLAAVAARQLTSQQNNTPESRGPTPGAVGPQLPLPPNLPPPPSALAVATSTAPAQSPQISPNEITAIQNALQHQQQNIQQHLQNLLLLQQSANSLGNIAAAANNNVPPTPFMGNQVHIYIHCKQQNQPKHVFLNYLIYDLEA